MRWVKRFRDWLAANDSTPHPDHRPIRAAAVGVQRLPDGGCYLVVTTNGLRLTIYQFSRQARADLVRDLQSPNRAELFPPDMVPWMG